MLLVIDPDSEFFGQTWRLVEPEYVSRGDSEDVEVVYLCRRTFDQIGTVAQYFKPNQVRAQALNEPLESASRANELLKTSGRCRQKRLGIPSSGLRASRTRLAEVERCIQFTN